MDSDDKIIALVMILLLGWIPIMAIGHVVIAIINLAN